MHVVFFNRSYAPDQTATGRLLTELCEDLSAVHGMQVTVVTGPPLAPSPGAEAPARQRLNGVNVLRTWGTTFDKRRFTGRVANYLSYVAGAAIMAWGVRRADVVVALTDPPIIGVVAALKARAGSIPLVMAFQDLFPEVAALLPDVRSPAINHVLQRVNRWLVQRATVNVALGETMRQRLVDDKGAPPARTVVIANWADTDEIRPSPKVNDFSRQHGLDGAFVVMYSGNMGLSQHLGTLLDVAALLDDIPDLVLVFQGDGVARAGLEDKAVRRGLRNVRFLPFAPRETLSASFATADLFVVPLQADMAGYIVPSKLYGILAAGRPYIAAVAPASEVAALTRQHDCGRVVPPGEAQPLAEAIRFYYAHVSERLAAGARAREVALQFDRRGQVARYAELLRRVAGKA